MNANPIIPCKKITSYLFSDDPWLIHIDAIGINEMNEYEIHGNYTVEESKAFIITKPVPQEWNYRSLEELNGIEFEFLV